MRLMATKQPPHQNTGMKRTVGSIHTEALTGQVPFHVLVTELLVLVYNFSKQITRHSLHTGNCRCAYGCFRLIFMATVVSVSHTHEGNAHGHKTTASHGHGMEEPTHRKAERTGILDVVVAM